MTETTAEKYKAIQDRYKELAEENPCMTAGEIYQTIAKEFYLSPFTIKDICNKSLKKLS